jgi:hypothetical protein
MALQYDNPVWTNQITAALAANPGISDTTSAAISQLLKLDTVESVVVAGWDGVAPDVTVPTGKTADVVAIAVAADATLTLPDSVADAKVVIIESDADVTLTVGEAVNPLARAAVVEPVGTDITKVVVGGNGDDTLTVLGNGNTVLDGGDGNDTLTTGAGNDVIIGGFGDDTINSGAGNDIIITGIDHDTIDAGAGRDLIQVEGASTAFAVSVSGDSLILTGAGGVNTVDVKNAEFVTFNDGNTLAIASTDAEASALRLYEGLLGRDADNGGAEHFTTAIDNGASLTAVTNEFLSSAEYQNGVNASYVESLYTSLLGRTADSEGEAGWLNALASGSSRSDVAAAISASAEAQTANQSDSAFVEALYQSALGRNADNAGLDNWLSALSNGASRDTVVSSIVGSLEAANKANSEFVDSLYNNALGRDANQDAVGKAGWMAALEHGATQAEVAIGIVGSPEAQDHITNVVVVHGAV